MKGVALKCSRQEPGLASDCPPPSAPAAVYYNKFKNLDFQITLGSLISKTIIMHHDKTVSNPKTTPPSWTIWNVNGLRMDSNDIGWGFTNHASRNVLANAVFPD